MSFWSPETIRNKFSSQGIVTIESSSGVWVDGYSNDRVAHGAYELSLGTEVFVTSWDGRKRVLKSGQQIAIPPGQFALLLTHERVTIPPKSLGFISIKAGKKFSGLVNVSGFHVDPGYEGRLKFSVYNAGSRDVILTQGKPLFLLWLSDFDKTVDPDDLYPRKGTQNELTDEDIMKIHGEIASPGNLLQRLQQVEKFISMTKTMFTTMLIALAVTIVGGLVVNGLWDKIHPGK